MRDHTKIAAQEQFGALASSVNEISKSFEGSLKKNKILIKVDAPCLVLPFKQSTQEEINVSECWIFTMGDLNFHTAKENKFEDIKFYEAYEVNTHKIKFEYVDSYQKWKNNEAKIQSVLSDFNTTAILITKRTENEMKDN